MVGWMGVGGVECGERVDEGWDGVEGKGERGVEDVVDVYINIWL